MNKLTIRTVEAETYSIGHHVDRLNSPKSRIVVISARNKREALGTGKKEWRRQFDPSAFFRVYGEHAKN